MKVSIYDYISKIRTGDGCVIGYKVTKRIKYFSPRYKKWIIAETGDVFDGATGAIDIDSFGWIIHDVLCRDGRFKDGALCTNIQASLVLSDILQSENRWFRSKTWFVATWLFGGGKARKNGMF